MFFRLAYKLDVLQLQEPPHHSPCKARPPPPLPLKKPRTAAGESYRGPPPCREKPALDSELLPLPLLLAGQPGSSLQHLLKASSASSCAQTSPGRALHLTKNLLHCDVPSPLQRPHPLP